MTRTKTSLNTGPVKKPRHHPPKGGRRKPRHFRPGTVPTRWIGVLVALLSSLVSQDLLLTYTDKLVEDGFRPDRGKPDDTPPDAAKEARVDEDDDDDDDDDDADEGGDPRVHSATFHQWGDDLWDLRVTTPPDQEDILDTDGRVELDSGRARVWSTLSDGTKRTKCKLVTLPHACSFNFY